VYDNLPINGLIERVFLVNNQVDLNTTTLLESIGTQGTLANRLAQSINDDGTLKTTAIDNALHSIEEHLDTNDFVRMRLDERQKLSFIAANATSLGINVTTISGAVSFLNTTLELEGSDSITWRYSGGKLSADTNFPSSVRHVHHYNIVPVTSNYKNYTTTSISTAYKEGSLRVYVNGVRLDQTNSVYVPFGAPSTITWTALKFSEGTATSGVVTGGDFSLSTTISSASKVVIDFDVLY
jgi:hypothetical protein